MLTLSLNIAEQFGSYYWLLDLLGISHILPHKQLFCTHGSEEGTGAVPQLICNHVHLGWPAALSNCAVAVYELHCLW